MERRGHCCGSRVSGGSGVSGVSPPTYSHPEAQSPSFPGLNTSQGENQPSLPCSSAALIKPCFLLPFGCRDESFYTLLRRPSDSDILP